MSINNIVAVTSGKGGTGKSTFSVNLGIASASEKNPVLLIDMDAGMRCLDLLLGVCESVLMDIGDVLKGADLERSVLPVLKYKGLNLLAAPASREGLDPEKFCELISAIRDSYSLIIIDFPAGSDYTLYNSLPKDTHFICVCNPDPVSVRDAAFCGQALREMSRKGLLVINKYNFKYTVNSRFNNLDDIINETGLRLLGIVPASLKLSHAFSNGNYPRRGREAKAFGRIYGRISGKPIPLPKLKKI